MHFYSGMVTIARNKTLNIISALGRFMKGKIFCSWKGLMIPIGIFLSIVVLIIVVISAVIVVIPILIIIVILFLVYLFFKRAILRRVPKSCPPEKQTHRIKGKIVDTKDYKVK